MSLYEIAILGKYTTEDREKLEKTITKMVEDFDLTIGKEFLILDEITIRQRDPKVAFAAVYFASQGSKNEDEMKWLLESKSPIIPTIGPVDNFGQVVPDFLQGANGIQRSTDDPEYSGLAAALLECVGLLRRQRRIFVSYRRTESRAAAIQLHDTMTEKGFDVFLDTHDIRPGDPFQEILWHRLVDSDIVIMLDTPTYFDSMWTRQEFGRARAKEIHILRVIWPNHTPNQTTELAENIYLKDSDLSSKDGPFEPTTLNTIINQAESLRSRSIAARYKSITGKFKAELAKIDAMVEGIGAHRAIAVRLDNGELFWAYPIVGIPTAELLNDVADKARTGGQNGIPVLIYDHVGIRDLWMNHLAWLNNNINEVKAIKVNEAAWEIKSW